MSPTQRHEEEQEDFSFKKLFIPLTTFKAIHWIVFIGIITYANMLLNGFVHDDGMQIVSNPIVHSFTNILLFFAGGNFFDVGSGQIASAFYRPIPSVFFTLLYPVSGQQPFVFHLFQLSIHCVNTLLIFVFFRKFFSLSLSFVLAIIFLIHPINQESVAYISNLQENLFLFFGLLALILSTSLIKKVKYVISINLLLLLSLLSKETGLLFVPIIIVYTYFFNRKHFSKIYIFSVLGVTAFYIYLRFSVVNVVKITDGLVPIMQATFIERLMTVPAIIFYYLKIFLFPYQLALGHVWVVKSFNFSDFYFPLFMDMTFIFLIALFGLFLWRKHPKSIFQYLFFIFWFFLGISMHLQLIPLDMTVADRWFYFPFVGLLGIIGTVVNVISWDKKKIMIGLMLVSVVILLLAGRTIIRNQNWKSQLTLCEHDLPIVYNSYSMQSICAAALLNERQYDKAKMHYEIATKLAPGWGLNWYQYGLANESAGDKEKAREYYRKSIQISKEVNAYVSLAATYLKYEKDYKEAKKIVGEGLEQYPYYQRLELYLAVCEYRLGNKQQALEIATQSYQRSPTIEAKYVLTQISNDQEIVIE